MKIKMDVINNDALNRPAGYADAVVAAGHVSASVVTISPQDYTRLRTVYAPIGPHHNAVYDTSSEVRPQHRMAGLGDAVAAVAQPIAKMIDRVAGTNIQGCRGCKKRKDFLNRVVPFK